MPTVSRLNPLPDPNQLDAKFLVQVRPDVEATHLGVPMKSQRGDGADLTWKPKTRGTKQISKRREQPK